ncbi:MAG: undecaprenyl-phosphate glucose phosphotransferase [Calditrichaeota bacterium]|nr:undecaprenyl-phosphate glucose phosphotransferase [Calditrichota bacterium]
MLRQHSQFFLSLFAVADIALLALAWVLVYYLRFSFVGGVPPENLPPLKEYLFVLVPLVIIWPLVFRLFGLYRPHRLSSIMGETWDIIKLSTIAFIVMLAVLFLVWSQDYSRSVLIYFYVIGIILLISERWLLREMFHVIRRKGYNTRNALIVGAGNLGQTVATKIKDNPWTGIEISGYVDDQIPVGSVVSEVRVLGSTDKLAEVIHEHDVDQVFIALPVEQLGKRRAVVDILNDEVVTVRLVPDIYQGITLNASIEDFDGLLLFNLVDTAAYGWNRILKRTVDIILSAVGIAVTFPVMLMITIGIKLTSPGPVLFKQRRYGMDDKVIWIYKFRSMTALDDGDVIPQATRNDPRLTRFGTFLRRSSLDELPQFFNVLQGRMSIVGPRPHAVAHNEYYRKKIKGYILRHKMKPGITGWAQVNGWRGETDTLEKMEKRIEYDLYYIEHWNIWFDVKIMWLTVWKGFVNKSAY